jgi:sensor domain CHASE-containing protein
MKTNDYILLVVIAFFGLTLYSIQKDEKRKSDRRQQHLPHPVERRIQDRRRKSLRAYLTWGVRSQLSKLTHRDHP